MNQMKNSGLMIFLITLFSLSVFAVCDDEPTIETSGKVLKELKIKKSRAGTANEFAEIGLFIKASVKDASWEKKDAEAAVLTVFVDGKYNQDAILFAGEKSFEYQMLLGKYNSSDEHQITIVLNKARSAPNVENVKIQSAFSTFFEDLTITKPPDRSIPAYLATLNAPLIYLRPNTIDKFSDIPLLTYYEIFDEPENIKKIRYTTIFTNEDGGTQSAALMARWGRMTDIEWIYEMRVSETGGILSQIYQGANHETRNFQGKRFGSHPLIFDATVNNNFADAGCSPLRVSPLLVQTDLSNGLRENVMDAFPWTYRIMAEEATRENRINSKNLSANTIDNLQNYLYVEVYSENDSAAVAVEVQMTDGKTSRSDSGDARLRVDRSGYKRIAVRLPSPNSSLKSLSLICQPTSNASNDSVCRNARIVKFIRLDENDQIFSTKNPSSETHSLKSGENLSWSLTAR